MRLDLNTLIPVVKGRLVGENVQVEGGVATDTRRACSGALFVALSGDRFDAHDFLDEARQQGAAALLVSRTDHLPPDVPALVVADTRRALGELAAFWRRQFDIPVVAITGSNGKTTTKEMLACILKTAYGADKVLATSGNFNNDIGLPLTLLQLTPQHRAAVVEMGMNHPGEIARLMELARPTIGLVTNAQRAHMEHMMTLDAVAQEKGAIYEAPMAVVNADDPHMMPYWHREREGRKACFFSLGKPADVWGEWTGHRLETRLQLHFGQEYCEVALQIPGRHNAANALAAAAVGYALGLPLATVAEGLAAFSGVPGRLQKRLGPEGIVILDDTYNANPDSVQVGINVLAELPALKILVLGDMGEVGAASAQYHDEIGGYARSMGVDRLYALGEASVQAVRNFGEGARHFKTPEALVKTLQVDLAALRKEAPERDITLLVKGSRFMKMERIVAALLSGAECAQSERSA